MKQTLINVLLWTSFAAAQTSVPVPAPGNVALRLDEYDRLVNLAAQPAKRPDNPPVPFAMQRALLTLQAIGGTASGSIQLEGEVLATGLTKLPISAGMTVFDARRDGGDLPLTWDGGASAAVLRGPGGFRLALNAGMPISLEAGRASLVIPGLSAGTVELVLTVPGDNTSVNIGGGLVVARNSSGGKTTIEATLTGGQAATISWATREAPEPAAPKDVRYLSDVKSLITVGEADLAMVALAEVTVVQGAPREFPVKIPAGWEVTGATGATLDSSEMQAGALRLKVSGAAQSHAFLITMERPVTDASAATDVVSFPAAQRETGEIVVEAAGTMELRAEEAGGVKRMDLKEASEYLRSMARQSAQAAFRYHRQPGESPGVALNWTRFADSKLPGAVAESAIVTTLVTREGRSLTEIRLLVRNRQQPFLKVTLPAGASIVSADVAGETVKPVQGADGSRVPLMRAGFRPTAAYFVSFVMMHSGTPFARKGGGELTLPGMDVPIGLVKWEVFLPGQYRVKDFGGDAIAAGLVGGSPGADLTPVIATRITDVLLAPGTIGGLVTDASGGVVPHAKITVRHEATGTERVAFSDQAGKWSVMSMPAGRVTVQAEFPGFNRYFSFVDHPAGESSRVDITLNIGGVAETVTVMASTGVLNTESAELPLESQKKVALKQQDAPAPPSSNVTNLQRRVAGVLPIPVDVPKAGTSYRFVRPLVVDEETKLTFAYRTGR